jgi:hypothetical protein
MKRIDKFKMEISKYNVCVDFNFNVNRLFTLDKLTYKLDVINKLLSLLPTPEDIVDIPVETISVHSYNTYGIVLTTVNDIINLSVNPDKFLELKLLIKKIKPLPHIKGKNNIENFQNETFSCDIEDYTIKSLKSLKLKIIDRIDFLNEDI